MNQHGNDDTRTRDIIHILKWLITILKIIKQIVAQFINICHKNRVRSQLFLTNLPEMKSNFIKQVLHHLKIPNRRYQFQPRLYSQWTFSFPYIFNCSTSYGNHWPHPMTHLFHICYLATINTLKAFQTTTTRHFSIIIQPPSI